MVPPPLHRVLCGLSRGSEIAYEFAPVVALLATLERRDIIERVAGLIGELEQGRESVG